jgi:hypothetical protein
MAEDDPELLMSEIQAARAVLPERHRALLDELGVQETTIDAWPEHVLDLYRTLKAPTPARAVLIGAAAVYLDELRTVAFNQPALLEAIKGLDATGRRQLVAPVAWHEYGHALSINCAKSEHRERGLELLALAPPGVQLSIDYPDRYRRKEVFDELIATVYAMLVGRVRTSGYGRPDYLHDDVFTVFKEVIPWPQTP